jgi:hypothetical protein
MQNEEENEKKNFPMAQETSMMTTLGLFFASLVLRPVTVPCAIHYCLKVVMALVVKWRPGVGEWC